MASAEEPASWRLAFADSEEDRPVPIVDFHTSQTGSAAKLYPADDDALALPRMPATNAWLNENGHLILQAKSDAADIVESEECNGFIPVVLRQKSTGILSRKSLRVGDDGTADFVGFRATADVTLNISNFTKLGHYVVPAGFEMTLDAGKPVFLYLGDDTA